MKLSTTLENLFIQALNASKKAYAPYSNFHVGAAILTSNREVITGCNIENRSYGLSNCAERTAIFKAISEGKTCTALAVATPDASYPVAPCGACRQVISEFMQPQDVVIFGSSLENVVVTNVGQLYPFDSLHELKKPVPDSVFV